MRSYFEPKIDTLLMSARAGTQGCLAQLLQAFSSYLWLLAAEQIDHRVQARVSPSDVVQDTLFEAHRDFVQFVGQSTPEFLSWLRQILIRNLSRVVEQHVLTEKRDARREVSLDKIGASVDRSATCLAAFLHDDITSPSSHAQRAEQVLALADVVAQLAPDYRQVIVLRHLEGLPFKEVAERMGRSQGAVRMLWLRAIEQLRSGFSARGLL